MRELGYYEEEVCIGSAKARLWGTLLVREGRNEGLTAALIIPGSGPTDRDGNSPLLPGKKDSLKLLAETVIEFLRTMSRN